MKIIIGKPINGISVNGDKYLLNDEGDFMEFASVEDSGKFQKSY